jgi:uncharacterized protein YqiB (DUF1249 family)
MVAYSEQRVNHHEQLQAMKQTDHYVSFEQFLQQWVKYINTNNHVAINLSNEFLDNNVAKEMK